MEPKHLRNLLITVALLYLLFPRDLIPDFIGKGLGLIDDVSLMAALAFFYRKHLRALAARAAGSFAGAEGETRSKQAGPNSPAFDPYHVLGIAASASKDTIRTAYRSRMAEYHPDKVAHLGEELQVLAHRKVLEIQQAYQQLTK